MWFLESDGDIFNRKRLWLRPGKKFLFGRTSTTAEAGGFVIANKTISKKHLTIEVTSPEEGDTLDLGKRSNVILKDLGSKIGTVVDGEQIKGLEHTLNGESHEIIVGHYEHYLRITWKPVVLSFSFSAKELKSNPLEALSRRFEGLDIKVIRDFIRGSTTHLVAKKRNTPTGLEALINGCYIVDYSFIDSVTAAAEQPAGGPSPLETDFDTNWPDALNFLPLRSKEPIQRPNSDFHPDFRRQAVFDGYTFVFYERVQFDTLLGPITSGRGKAVLRQAEPGVTTVEDFVRYVKSVAGEKGLGEFEDGSGGKGVVVVRYQPPDGPKHSWYSDFGTRVSLQLDHRLIEQNEFLDAIINNDASVLRKPLEIEQSGTTAPPGTAVSATTVRESPSSIRQSTALGDVPENSAPPPNAPPRRMGRSRRTVTSRFKGFDEDLDTPSIPEPSQAQVTTAPISQSQESGMFVSQDLSIKIDQFSQDIFTQSRSSRKRPTSPTIEEDNDEEILDQVAPTAANLKRRRLEEDLARRRRGESSPPLAAVEPKPRAIVRKTKKTKKEPVDILEVARQRREKEEEIAQAEREALQEAMGDMDIDEVRKLALIEEMPMRSTAPPSRTIGRADEGSRWDERWNGRKNFKKFKRRGEAGGRAVNKVMIALEEVKKKDFGIGVEYWLAGSKESQKKKGKGRMRDSQAVSQIDTQSGNSARIRNRAQDLEDEAVPESDAEIIDALAGIQRSSATRSQTQILSDKTKATQRQTTKRQAEPMAKPASTKKARQSSRRVDADSDDSDDGLGFKFRKRK